MKLSVQIVEAVSEERGVDKRDLPPLGNSIDPDALNRIFDPNHASGLVTFDYANVTVQVDDAEEVNVYSDIVED